MTDIPAASSGSRSGSELRRRAGVVTFRASAAERVELETAAERAGLSIGSYLRSRALAAPTTRAMRRPGVERAALSQILAQLGRAGNNLNQIARVLNSGRETPVGIDAAIKEFRAACGVILEAIGKRPPPGAPS